MHTGWNRLRRLGGSGDWQIARNTASRAPVLGLGETILSYAPTKVGTGVFFFQSLQAGVSRACARVCAVNVNHDEGLLQPLLNAFTHRYSVNQHRGKR